MVRYHIKINWVKKTAFVVPEEGKCCSKNLVFERVVSIEECLACPYFSEITMDNKGHGILVCTFPSPNPDKYGQSKFRSSRDVVNWIKRNRR